MLSAFQAFRSTSAKNAAGSAAVRECRFSTLAQKAFSKWFQLLTGVRLKSEFMSEFLFTLWKSSLLRASFAISLVEISAADDASARKATAGAPLLLLGSLLLQLQLFLLMSKCCYIWKVLGKNCSSLEMLLLLGMLMPEMVLQRLEVLRVLLEKLLEIIMALLLESQLRKTQDF